MVRLFGRPRLRRAVVGNGEAADASDPGHLSPGYSRLRASDWSTDTAWPTRHAGRALRRTFELAFYGPKDLNTVGTIRSDRYQRGTFQVGYSQSRAGLGGFFYPGSRYGESEYLFGSRAGVRPNPRVSATGGLTVTF